MNNDTCETCGVKETSTCEPKDFVEYRMKYHQYVCRQCEAKLDAQRAAELIAK